MMWALYLLIFIGLSLLVFLAVSFILFRPDDYSAFDGHDFKSRTALPSLANKDVIERVRNMGKVLDGVRGRARILAMREYMDSISDDLQMVSTVTATEQPRGEWVIAPGADTRRRILYIHGGAWMAGSPRSHRSMTDQLSQIGKAAVFAVDYRLMPEYRYMAGVEDCRKAYEWLLRNGPEGEQEAQIMVIAGDSAGGSHTLALIAWLRDQRLRQADAAIALSPSTDMTMTAPSNRSNIATDPMLGPMFGGLQKVPLPVLWWFSTATFRMRPASPVASPLRGPLHDLPPTLIQVSDCEMLADNARRYAAKAQAAGSPVELHIWQGMVHVWQIFGPMLPEADEAFDDMAEFLRANTGAAHQAGVD
ncbi:MULTISPECIES: alpha/beta hydrolase [unclassified Marinobacter]|uniref:alpha/beta hydrolase n=1 Tax=unclassified Marinobacter TaxID=83889 RepID=UPI000C01644E|nr:MULTISPECIES: alpha/beta hydrolase [unclassified Marinobacter]PFG09411.1 acetyl esterase/lipase [Marinobacter sp. LV10MA510-1]PFG51314.1 acetyl esterase/lipase [Marinobacter sp. LV10R520-4]